MQNSSQDVRKKALGRSGEKRAVKYLKKAGLRIVKVNYKTPFGEADIVAREGETFVLCEVKTRTGETFGTPAEAVDFKKQERYINIARYMQMRAGEELSVRFDVVEVFGDEINHIAGAFVAGNRKF